MKSMAQASEAPPPLRIGFVGSGFIAKFHAKSFQSVRHAQIAGVYSPTAANREALAAAVNDAELGPCRPTTGGWRSCRRSTTR
jgi:predicted dehydrogenase